MAVTGPRFDAGLQPERTELAWRRTTLAVAVGSLVALRVLPPALGALGVAAGLVGLGFSVVLWLLTRRRARALDLALGDPTRPLPGAALLLALGGGALVFALLGVLYVVREVLVEG